MERVTRVELALFQFGRLAPYRLGDTRIVKELATVAEVESAARGFGDRSSTSASRPRGLADGSRTR